MESCRAKKKARALQRLPQRPVQLDETANDHCDQRYFARASRPRQHRKKERRIDTVGRASDVKWLAARPESTQIWPQEIQELQLQAAESAPVPNDGSRPR